MTIRRSDLLYGIDINFSQLGASDEDEGINWDSPVIQSIREFAYAHDLEPLMSGDSDAMFDFAIGVPLYQVMKQLKESKIVCIGKMKLLFEEKTKNGVLEELVKRMGQPVGYEADVHMMIEET